MLIPSRPNTYKKTIGQEEYNAKLKVFETHMHAHNLCTSMVVCHQSTNNNNTEKDDTIVKSMAQYHGYGNDENWKLLNGTILNNVDEKETLTILSTFDTFNKSAIIRNKLYTRTHYSVGLLKEMCGIILLYYLTNDIANALGELH